MAGDPALARISFRGSRALAATLAALVLVGCGNEAGNPVPTSEGSMPAKDASSASPTGATSSAGDGGIVPPRSSPLAAFQLQGADLYTIQAAEAELAGDCMKRFGFEPIDPGLDRDAAIAEQRENETRIYGITDLGEAKTYGYVPESVARGTTAPQMSASYAFVYTGERDGGVAVPLPGKQLTSPGDFGGLRIPPGGCRGEAREKLWGNPSSDVKDGFAQSLRIRAYDESQADARVQKVLSSWAACMSEEGYSYQSPLDVQFDRQPSAQPSATEVNTAIADIGCKKATDLIAVWNSVDVELQTKAIEDNQLQLSEDKDKIDAALKNAAAVLDGE